MATTTTSSTKTTPSTKTTAPTLATNNRSTTTATPTPAPAAHTAAPTTAPATVAAHAGAKAKLTSKFPAREIFGGDVRSLLSATDLDRLLAPALGEQYVPAVTTYDVRIGRASASGVAAALRRRLERAPWILMPVHVRHHWTTAIIQRRGVGYAVNVYDSAPTASTRKEILALLTRLGFPGCNVVCHARQETGTNECGLHVVLVGANLMPVASSAPPPLPQSGLTVSLAPWRDYLATSCRGGLTAAVVNDLFRLAPEARLLDHGTSSHASAPSPNTHVVDRPTPVTTPTNHVVQQLDAQQVAGSAMIASVRQPPGHDENGTYTRIPPPYASNTGESTALPSYAQHVAAQVASKPTPQPQQRQPATIPTGGAPSFPWRGTRNTENICFANALGAALRYAVAGESPSAATLIAWARELGMNASTAHGRRHEDADELFARIFERLAEPVQRVVGIRQQETTVASCACRGAHPSRSVDKPEVVPFIRVEPSAASLDKALQRELTSSGGGREACAKGCADAWRTTTRTFDASDNKQARGVFFGITRMLRRRGATVKDRRVCALPGVLPATCGPFTSWWLAAVVAHRGSPNSGHWVTYAREAYDKPWILHNDDTASTASTADMTMEVTLDGVLVLYKPPQHFSHDPYNSETAVRVEHSRTKARVPAAASAPAATAAPEPHAVGQQAQPTTRQSATVAQTSKSAPATRDVAQQPSPRHKTKPGQTAPPPVDANPKRITTDIITHGRVRAITKDFRVGDIVRVRWAFHGEAGSWIGTVTRQRPIGLEALLEYTHELCEHCHEWHALDEPICDQEMPFPKVVYFEIEQLLAAPTVAPACDATDFACMLDDDEELLPRSQAPATDLLRELCGESETAAAASRARPAAKRAAAQTTTSRTSAPALPHAVASPEVPALGDPERECNAALSTAATTRLTGGFGRAWFIHPDRPAHVHALVWRQLAESTRRQHRTWLWRVRGMPADLIGKPLAAAIIELLLRFARDRNWRWSTIASALSCVASAMRSLPLYTDRTRGIDLRDDPAFAAATKRAQHLARVTTTPDRLSTPLSFAQYSTLMRDIKVPSTRLLGELAWSFAARVGDVRQVCPGDIKVDKRDGGRGSGFPIVATFRFGKGAAWWGPYSIHAVVPRHLAQTLLVFCRDGRPHQPMFSAADQDRLARATRTIPGCTLRSFRRGAITHAADCGVLDADLQLLSGHKRRDTLLRYLGWGRTSASAKVAAHARAAATRVRARVQSDDVEDVDTDDDDDSINAGGHEDDEYIEIFGGGCEARNDDDVDVAVVNAGGDPNRSGLKHLRPAKMGLRSGYCGDEGRRVAKQTRRFPLQPPTSTACGIVTLSAAVTNLFPLHVKDVALISWSAVQELAVGTPLANAVGQAKTWVTSTERYGIDWAPLAPHGVPVSRFSPADVDVMVSFGKLVLFAGTILSFVRGFPLVQENKQNRRPIFEPFVNQTAERAGGLAYPSRQERRETLNGSLFRAEFDFAAFYDQFMLSREVQAAMVMRTKDASGRDALYACTRLPMGASFSVFVAQTCTWVVVHPLIARAHVKVSTCIDNVCICATDGAAFVDAVRTFLARSDFIGATINGRAEWNITDTEIMQRGHRNFIGPFVFLGEAYKQQRVQVGDKSIIKLRLAHARIMDPTTILTRRQFAAVMGLLIFCAHTLDVGMWRFFSLFRTYSRLVSSSAAPANDVMWDEPVRLAPTALADMAQAVGLLTANSAVPLRPLLAPGTCNDDYDTIVIVDASCAGWGAYVSIHGRVTRLRAGWRTETAHSAHSEPMAAIAALQWARRHGGTGHTAVVSDHRALALAQRRWWSGYGGFSAAHRLNDFFSELYGTGPLDVLRLDVFFVEGTKNIADGPSRSVAVGAPLEVLPADIDFPNIAAFEHPYRAGNPRMPWQV